MSGLVSESLEVLVTEFPNAMEKPYCGAGCGPGWLGILREALTVLERTGAQVAQIKEKFGGLLLYFDPPKGGWKSEEDFKACCEAETKAERASFTICEDCGAPGTLRKGDWLRTLCDKHAKGSK